MPAESTTRGEHTRVGIIAAAQKLFIERGYHGTSTRQIAQNAGVALGNIYNHFSSKEELFLVVLMERHPIHEILPALQAAQGETVEELVRDAATRMVDKFEKRLEFMNLMFIELVEFKGEHIPRLFETVFPQAVAFTQRALEGRNELRPIPIPILLQAFFGLFFSFMITELLIGRQLPPQLHQGALEHFIDIYLHGILIPPTSTH